MDWRLQQRNTTEYVSIAAFKPSSNIKTSFQSDLFKQKLCYTYDWCAVPEDDSEECRDMLQF